MGNYVNGNCKKDETAQTQHEIVNAVSWTPIVIIITKNIIKVIYKVQNLKCTANAP